MPETVAAAIEYAAEAYGTEMTWTAAEIYQASQVIVAVASVYAMREQQRKAQNSAIDQYNNSLRDRYAMVRANAAPRQVVLGRQRVSGPIGFIQSYGADRASLIFTVLLASHECDAIEAIYIDDELAVLDGSGNVLAVQRRDLFTITTTGGTFTLSSDPNASTVSATVQYGTTTTSLTVSSVSGRDVTVTGATAGTPGTVTITYQPAVSPYVTTAVSQQVQTTSVAITAGTRTLTLAAPPVTGSVSIVIPGDPTGNTPDTAVTVTGVSGSVVTYSSPVSGSATVNYTAAATVSRLKITSHLGAAGQTADADIIAALPGMWTSSHVMAGQCYLTVQCQFDTDAFPSSLPNISALVRGAKLYDPRTGTTAWGENPALMMRYVTTSPLLGNLPTSAVIDANISAEATVCDASVTYTVNGQAYTRAKYTAGTVIKAGTRAADALNDLAAAMAGRWCFVDGALRVRAGAYRTPLQTLDETWLSGTAGVQYQCAPARADMYNSAAGKFLDSEHDYIETDYPTVAPSSYATADGATIPTQINLPSVTFIGQAQQVVSSMMRDARAGATLVAKCNMRAYQCEPFDTLTVNLDHLGLSGATFEVIEPTWTADGEIELHLKQTDPTAWDMAGSFTANPVPPNSRAPSPWTVPTPANLACASGTAELLKQDDGTIVSRINVTFDAITDRYVLDTGGGVQVQWRRASDPDTAWRSTYLTDGSRQTWLTDVYDGGVYLVRARAYNVLVCGAWCTPVLHQVVGKTALPANVSGLSATQQPGGVAISVTPSTEADVIAGGALELRVGASWAAGTRIFRGPADRYTWPWPSAGSYTIRAKWYDSTGNESAADATASITVGSGVLIDSAQLAANAATEIASDAYDFGGVSAGGGSSAIVQRTWTVTPTADCVVEFSATIVADTVLPDSGNQLWWTVTPSGGGETTLAAANSDTSARQTFPAVASFTAYAGVALDFKLWTRSATSSPHQHLFASSMRATMIKR